MLSRSVGMANGVSTGGRFSFFANACKRVPSYGILRWACRVFRPQDEVIGMDFSRIRQQIRELRDEPTREGHLVWVGGKFDGDE